MKFNKIAYKSLMRKSKIKQFSRTMKNGTKILILISKKGGYECVGRVCLRTVTSSCLLWTRYDTVTQNSDEWLASVNRLWFCDSGQWHVAASCEHDVGLWLRTATSGWLASVNTLWFFAFNKNMEFIDPLVVLSFSKMIVSYYVGS